MAGELDDFLRRAAQRRVANAAAKAEQRQRDERSSRPVRPEYTDRHRERTATVPVESDEDVVLATLADENTRRPQSPSTITPTIAPTNDQAVNVARLRNTFEQEHVAPAPAPPMGAPTVTSPPVNPTAAALIRLLKDPNGIRQAVLVREIFDRPTHRW